MYDGLGVGIRRHRCRRRGRRQSPTVVIIVVIETDPANHKDAVFRAARAELVAIIGVCQEYRATVVAARAAAGLGLAAVAVGDRQLRRAPLPACQAVTRFAAGVAAPKWRRLCGARGVVLLLGWCDGWQGGSEKIGDEGREDATVGKRLDDQLHVC